MYYNDKQKWVTEVEDENGNLTAVIVKTTEDQNRKLQWLHNGMDTREYGNVSIKVFHVEEDRVVVTDGFKLYIYNDTFGLPTGNYIFDKPRLKDRSVTFHVKDIEFAEYEDFIPDISKNKELRELAIETETTYNVRVALDPKYFIELLKGFEDTVELVIPVDHWFYYLSDSKLRHTTTPIILANKDTTTILMQKYGEDHSGWGVENE